MGIPYMEHGPYLNPLMAKTLAPNYPVPYSTRWGKGNHTTVDAGFRQRVRIAHAPWYSTRGDPWPAALYNSSGWNTIMVALMIMTMDRHRHNITGELRGYQSRVQAVDAV